MRSLVFAAALAAPLLAARPARSADAPPPQRLAEDVAAQIRELAREVRARTVRITVAGAPGLEGVPALIAAADELETSLFAPGTKLEAAAEGAPADLEGALQLSRSAGRVALGGAVRAASRTSWVLASDAESPSWAPWLEQAFAPAADARGFVWRRALTVDGEVLDADGGDLDGDGIAEFVAVTRTEALAFRVGAHGRAELLSRTPLPPAESAPVATRAPRAFVRVVEGAGGPAEVLVRFTDERRTRVLAWSPSTARLETRGEREGVVLASRPTARGPETIAVDPAPGTNHFAEAPKVRRGASWKQPASLGPWLDLRGADLTATARVTETGPAFALLDAEGSLRLLRGDLADAGRVTGSGSAFALADWDGDGRAEPLFSGAARGRDADTLTLELPGKPWSASVDGWVAALAAGPQPDGTAALAFVRTAGVPSTSVWLLRRETR